MLLMAHSLFSYFLHPNGLLQYFGGGICPYCRMSIIYVAFHWSETIDSFQ